MLLFWYILINCGQLVHCAGKDKTEFKDNHMAIYIVILTIVIFIDFLIIDDVVSNVKLLT